MSTLYQQRPAGSGMATAAVFCGLAGTACSLVTLIWTVFSFFNLDISNPPPPNVPLMILSFVIFIAALVCGILGIVFGAASCSRARREGLPAPAMGRAGMFLGIVALVLLLANIVVSIALGINAVLEGTLERFRRRRSAELLLHWLGSWRATI